MIPSPGKTASTVLSPLTADRSVLRTVLPKMYEVLTTDSRRVIPGRIDVNQAPLAVLRSIPGLDDAATKQIVSARRVQVAGDTQLHRHAVWLLTEGIVDLPRMRAISPFVTGGGDVFRTQLIAYFDDRTSTDPSPTARMEVVVDAAQTPARVVASSDLRSLGIGFAQSEFGRDPMRGPATSDASSPMSSDPIGNNSRTRTTP